MTGIAAALPPLSRRMAKASLVILAGKEGIFTNHIKMTKFFHTK